MEKLSKLLHEKVDESYFALIENKGSYNVLIGLRNGGRKLHDKIHQSTHFFELVGSPLRVEVLENGKISERLISKHPKYVAREMLANIAHKTKGGIYVHTPSKEFLGIQDKPAAFYRFVDFETLSKSEEEKRGALSCGVFSRKRLFQYQKLEDSVKAINDEAIVQYVTENLPQDKHKEILALPKPLSKFPKVSNATSTDTVVHYLIKCGGSLGALAKRLIHRAVEHVEPLDTIIIKPISKEQVMELLKTSGTYGPKGDTSHYEPKFTVHA